MSNGFFAEIKIKMNNKLELPKDIEELALYVLSGKLEIKDRSLNAGEMFIFNNKSNVSI